MTARRALASVAILIIFIAGLIAALAGRANAAVYDAECKRAWNEPNGQAAEYCRSQGWTIKSRLVVHKKGVLTFSRLPHCKNEDGSGQKSACLWNGKVDGNGKGKSFWVSRSDKIHYVKIYKNSVVE